MSEQIEHVYWIGKCNECKFATEINWKLNNWCCSKDGKLIFMAEIKSCDGPYSLPKRNRLITDLDSSV